MNARYTTHSPATTVPRLRLHLLGGFRATRDSGPALPERWSRLTAQALVRLLAVVPGHRLHREQVMDICWPDAGPQAAQGSLRVALHAARRTLEPELAPRAASSYLIADGTLLALDPATVWIDADHVEEAARSALDHGDEREMADALAQFAGELLPEDRYATWAEGRRAQLAALKEKLLLGLASAHLEAGRLPEAAAFAEEVLGAGPAEELAHRVLIDVYTRQGLRRRAVRQYHMCRAALEAELGVRPGPETERLHRAALAAAPAPVPSAPSLPAPLRVPAATPLRGREELLDRLLTAAGPAVRLLTGEAGVGKTRLVGEVARLSAAAGTAVLWGAGHDAEGHTPYGAFAEALDGWLAERDPAQRARVGTEYPELAAFLPALGRVRADTERSPEEERDRLFRATAGLLDELASVQPVLIVLDDLHAADEGSFQLLSHLARRAAQSGGPRFLLTYREEELPDGDPRRSGLRSLLRQGLAAREEVRRLSQEACLAVVRDTVRRTVGPEVRGAAVPKASVPRTPAQGTSVPRTPTPGQAVPGADGEASSGRARGEGLNRVWELSLGNPLFAVELAHGLAEGDPGAVAPDGVRQLVAERLGRLDHDTRRIVEALSVAGPETALSELLDVAAHGLHPPVPDGAATDALERAIGASLVEEREIVVAGRHEPGLIFRHPLVRLTCYEQLSALRRRQLHGAFAQAVLRRRPDAVDTLASHFTRADDPRAAEYLRRAAARAAALFANDTADRYYRDLVARLDVDAARARLAHSQVLRRMGDFGRAAEVLRLALEEFVRRDDHEDVVLAASWLADTLGRTGAPEAGRQVLREHPVTADTAPEPAAAHFLALSVICRVQGRYEEGYAAAQQALAAASRVPGRPGQGLLARAYGQQAADLGLSGRLDEARRAADLALGPAERYGDPTLLGSVLSTLRENGRRGGQLREAVAIGQRALTLAEQSGDPTAAAFERANLAELHLLLEEFDEARVLAEAAVAGAEQDDAWCLPYTLATLATVRMRTGRASEAGALLGRAEGSVAGLVDRQAGHGIRTARAELALRTGRPHDVLRAVEGRAEDAPVLVAWGEILTGRAGPARELADAEAVRAGRTGERIAEAEACIALAVALSRLAADEREAGAARTSLARAEDLARALPYPAGVRHAATARRLMDGATGATGASSG
ncbi:ATP-binding protein [Streptomyces durocortorensis]|uniref:AAA family ATPase n=1 Tax=Streptomyces durocortorensis TaxID=2811104 RepID=A0ABS2I456_9ACTN|nr:AAA family ATPase [Streptomyces durocortorensis]MBM7056984.1 AAA family ATPase [Streptomyces durocortorensis]